MRKDVTARQILGYLNEGAVISQRRLPNGAIGSLNQKFFPDAAITRLRSPNYHLLATLDRCRGKGRICPVPQADDRLEPGDMSSH